MGPYRALPPAPPRSREPTDPDARMIYGLLLALGIVRLLIVLVLHEPFGAEATLALALFVFGIVGLARAAR